MTHEVYETDFSKHIFTVVTCVADRQVLQNHGRRKAHTLLYTTIRVKKNIHRRYIQKPFGVLSPSNLLGFSAFFQNISG